MEDGAIKPIFKRGPALGLQAVIWLVIVATCFVLDYRSPTFHRWRNNLAVVILPIQEMVNTPIKVTHWMFTSITAQKHLLEENAKLRAHQLLLQSKLQKLLVLERENAQLRELLKSTSKVAGQVKVAQLLAVSLNPSLQQIILDKGTKDNVYVGQPVLDAYGVLGQVIDVGPLTSKILLIADRRAAVPVQDSRNGLRAIAVGRGVAKGLALIDVPITSEIQVGDVFVTSGFGLHFPVGYPVGVVTKIQNVPGERFADIWLSPAAHLNQTQQVLLVWPDKVALSKTVAALLAKQLPSSKKWQQ